MFAHLFNLLSPACFRRSSKFAHIGVRAAVVIMATNPLEAARNLLEHAGDAGANRVDVLTAEKRGLQAQRAAVAKAIKNEERKRKRVLEMAKTLSTDDLLGVVAARAAAKGKIAQAKAKAKAKAQG